VRVVYDYEKEYRLLVARRPDEEQIATWRRVVLEDGYRTQPAEVRVEAPFGKGTWLRVVLREGRKRQIRETGTQIGLPVVKIIRVGIGTLNLGRLKPREWRYLTADEVAGLKGEPGEMEPGPREARFKPRKPEPKPMKRGEPGRRVRRAPEKGRRR
jgi:23S rRNA pseudouridine2605 synthase